MVPDEDNARYYINQHHDARNNIEASHARYHDEEQRRREEYDWEHGIPQLGVPLRLTPSRPQHIAQRIITRSTTACATFIRHRHYGTSNVLGGGHVGPSSGVWSLCLHQLAESNAMAAKLQSLQC